MSVAPPPPDPGFAWVTAVPWAITMAGTVINLAWNFLNYRLTTRLQRSTRQDTVKLEEFRRVRTPIAAAIDELLNQKVTLSSLSGSAAPMDEWRTQVADVQKLTIDSYGKLSTALERANESQFASGRDWLSMVEPAWDEFSTTIDGAYNVTRKEPEARAMPARAAAKLQSMVAVVEARLDEEIRKYLPAPANKTRLWFAKH